MTRNIYKYIYIYKENVDRENREAKKLHAIEGVGSRGMKEV